MTPLIMAHPTNITPRTVILALVWLPLLSTQFLDLISAQSLAPGTFLFGAIVRIDAPPVEESESTLERPVDRSSDHPWLQGRLVSVAIGGGTLLALLSILFAYLRMEHATRGFYSGRLQLVAAGLSFAVLVIAVVLWSLLVK